jgi:hypothetical protein
VQLSACGLEHVLAYSSDRFGDFAGGPIEIGGRLFRYRRDAGVEWLFHVQSQIKNRLFKNIRAENVVLLEFGFKVFIVAS